MCKVSRGDLARRLPKRACACETERHT
jgi:hypothetical protein